ncbi:MAG: fasciclin domain-containing protein [Deltaproteobacteria bacterium]|nr:fasciclin domain-containing protein [Deltaproteobacteria bacterium]
MIRYPALLFYTVSALLGCGAKEAEPSPAATQVAAKPASNVPPLSDTNIVSLATASKDHTTLIAAVKAADYVTSVAASGPLTVFAPTNEAFAALPPDTVKSLMKPENVDKLRELLKYHVTTSALQQSSFHDGQLVAMANGGKVTMGVKDGQVTVNGAKILASISAENGIIHVIDHVLIPPER